MKKKAFVIAIDGYASCGKSALAKKLAARLKFVHIDSGAMYRAIAYFFVQNSIHYHDTKTLEMYFPKIHIEYKSIANTHRIFLNGNDVSERIRSKKIDDVVSYFAESPSVRAFATQLQQNYQYATDGLIMDGRDIGTTVFPDAEIKFFITADIHVRAKRRYDELHDKTNTSLDEVKQNLLRRDNIDENRKVSPLQKPTDAIVIENTNLSIEQFMDKALSHIQHKLH